MQRKFIIGVSLFALAVAIVGSGIIYAWYSDTQSQTNNQFTTGTLKLSVNSGADGHIAKSGMKPGDYGTAANWKIQSTGTIGGDLSIKLVNVPTNALTNNLKVAFWITSDNTKTWKSGDRYLNSAGQIVVSNTATMPADAYQPLSSYIGKTWTGYTGITGDAGYFVASYNLPGTTDNTVQGLSAQFDIQFTLDQSQTTQDTSSA